jgi:hypothetical protein
MPQDQQSGRTTEEDDPERKRKPLKTWHRMQTTKEFSHFSLLSARFQANRSADELPRVLADLTTLSCIFSNLRIRSSVQRGKSA